MKSKKRYTSFLFFFFCLITINLVGQVNHEIILEVNTADIENPNVNDFCDFGQDPGISNEAYTIVAQVGDTVTWKGISTSNPNDRVEIRAINHQGNQGGRNIFGRNRLGGVDGEVQGIIRNTTEGELDYKYKIQFRVYNNGARRRGTFNIDPRIKVVGR